MSDYPEHAKLKALEGANQIVGNFIEWLGENGYVIGKYDDIGDLWPAHRSIEWFLAKHFEIDLDKLEEEKVAMLEEIRKASA